MGVFCVRFGAEDPAKRKGWTAMQTSSLRARSRVQKRNLFLVLLCSLLLSACGSGKEEKASLPEPVPVSPHPGASATSTSTSGVQGTASASLTATATETETATAPATATEDTTRTVTQTETQIETQTGTSSATEPMPLPQPRPEPQPQPNPPHEPGSYRLPEFDPRWGIKREIYEKTVRIYAAKRSSLANPRYVSVVDFSRPSSKKRFFLFDLAADKMHAFLTTHGFGSDPRHTGMAQVFSNLDGTRRSSLGAYLTRGTYVGGNGYSLRLSGLDGSNSNAAARLIVIHGADYVNEQRGYAGRSNGCFALDRKVLRGVVDRLKGGSLIVADR